MARALASFLWRHRAFLVFLLLAAVLRFAILFRAETHVHSDEAIIGLMGKRILDGRLLPVYMAGQVFNGGAAIEAYLAAASFALFGPGVVQLKACIVLLSLLSLAAVYAVVRRFWDTRTAFCAATVYAVAPTLLKWHFQVRGYGPYLLSVPVLFGLFLLVLETRPQSSWLHLALGLVSGIALWGMELVLPVVLAAALLLVLRRAVSPRQAAAALAGAIVGYGPAMLFNLTHGFASWRDIAARRMGGAPPPVDLPLLRLVKRFFLVEMPRFFGADTVMWYYPDRSLSGTAYAIVVLLALLAALWSVRRRAPGFVRDHSLRPGTPSSEDPLLYALVFLGACLPPYFLAGFRVPGYLIGGYGFIAVIVGTVLRSWLTGRRAVSRILGAAALAVLVLGGLYEGRVLIGNGGIETLVTDPEGNVRMKKIPSRDIEAMLDDLRSDGSRFVQASSPFQYPIIFESGEAIHASAALFGWNRRLFPETERTPDGEAASPLTIVFESGMPIRRFVDLSDADSAGSGLSERRFGALTVIRSGAPRDAGERALRPGGPR